MSAEGEDIRKSEGRKHGSLPAIMYCIFVVTTTGMRILNDSERRYSRGISVTGELVLLLE